MTGLTHAHGHGAAALITRRALAFDAIVAAVYHDGPDTVWSADEIADVANIIERFGFAPDGQPVRESQHDRALSVLSTLVTGLDEGESPATLLNYINLLGRDVVEEATGTETANGKVATEEQRAACHAGELLSALCASVAMMRRVPQPIMIEAMRQSAATGESYGLGALEELIDRIKSPPPTTSCKPSPASSTA